MIIDWDDVITRYPELSKLQNGMTTEVQTRLIATAEAVCHGRLASRYAVPFSSTNLTARDLCMDILFVQTQLTRQPEKAKALQESIDQRVKDLLSGTAQMMADSGVVATVISGDVVWSSSEDYHPVFGMGDIINARVSSEQTYDEAVARGDL